MGRKLRSEGNYGFRKKTQFSDFFTGNRVFSEFFYMFPAVVWVLQAEPEFFLSFLRVSSDFCWILTVSEFFSEFFTGFAALARECVRRLSFFGVCGSMLDLHGCTFQSSL